MQSTERMTNARDMMNLRSWTREELFQCQARMRGWGIEADIVDMLGLNIELPEPGTTIHLNVDCQDLTTSQRRTISRGLDRS